MSTIFRHFSKIPDLILFPELLSDVGLDLNLRFDFLINRALQRQTSHVYIDNNNKKKKHHIWLLGINSFL